MTAIKSSLQLFFPINPGGLNRQQFLNEVLCPQIQRGTSLATRSAFARILYDDHFDLSATKGLDKELYNRIIRGRANTRNKLFSINPDHHQELEQSYGTNNKPNAHLQARHNAYVKFMSNITVSEMAAMIPYVKLIYRYRDKANDPWKEMVVPFKSFSSEEEFKPSKILKSKFSRGDGAGIESVSVDRKFPGTGNLLSVTVDINFFFQNINVLTRKNKVNGKDLSFIKVMAFLSPKHEELILEYGYGISRFTDPSVIPPKMQTQILLNEKKRWILRYKGHTFGVQQDGSVKLGVSYTTQQDQNLLSKNSDIAIPKDKIEIASLDVAESTKSLLNTYRRLLALKSEIDDTLRNLKTKQARRRNAPKVKGAGQNKKELTKIKTQKKHLTTKLRETNKNLNSLRTQLAPLIKHKFIETIRRNKDLFKLKFRSEASSPTKDGIRNFSLKAEVLLEESKNGKLTSSKIADLATSFKTDQFENNVVLEEGIEGKDEKQKLTIVDNTAGTIFNVPRGTKRSGTYGDILFFPLRALIAAAYSDLNEEYKSEVPFVGLSNIETKSMGRNYSLNIGDILVSVDLFQKWYYNNYTSKSRITYAFGDFLDDIMTKLVPHILQESANPLFGRNRIGTIKPLVYLTKMTGNKKDEGLFRKVYTTNNTTYLKSLMSKLKTNSELKTSKDIKSVVLYTNLKNPSNPVGSIYLKRKFKDIQPPFQEDTDIKFNAPHIKIGANRGLLKDISFSAQDFPGLRTALWAQSLVESAEVLLKYRYSAAVKTVGNNVFFKGGLFTIPANPLGISNDAFDPGIVGYYVIQGVQDSVSPGTYETSFNGTWMYNPASQKGKSGTDVTQQEIDYEIPPINLRLSALGYLEDLFRLDAKTLARNGLSKDFKPISKKKDNLPAQNDNSKDIREPI
jgi:hypothetical protein